ncbi:MAG: hypothetical protein D6812_14335 [Deltaproteobacteria bacterium]|nr:MAG: hypothetical protein D6812_14335 [Deltaproteobacteria bacterium]
MILEKQKIRAGLIFSGMLLFLSGGWGNAGDAIPYRHRPALPLDTGWAFDPYWKNPRVERSIYEIDAAGKEGRVTHLLEAEWTDARHLVKPQDLEQTGHTPSGEAFHSMEFHALYEFPRKFATYAAFLEVLFDRHTMAPVKWQYAFHDTCGVIYKTIRGNTRTLEVDSYWEGRFQHPIASLEGVWFSDGLPVALRALPLAPGFRAEVQLLLNERGKPTPPPTIVPARIVVGKPERVSVPAGTFSALLVSVVAEGFEGHFWFDPDGVRPLVRFEIVQGGVRTKYILEKRDIIDYTQP